MAAPTWATVDPVTERSTSSTRTARCGPIGRPQESGYGGGDEGGGGTGTCLGHKRQYFEGLNLHSRSCSRRLVSSGGKPTRVHPQTHLVQGVVPNVPEGPFLSGVVVHQVEKIPDHLQGPIH